MMADAENRVNEPGIPWIATLLVVFGALAFLGGVILCIQTWPNETANSVWDGTAPGSGKALDVMAYIASLTSLAAGIVSGVLFFAGAAALTYLSDTRALVKQILSHMNTRNTTTPRGEGRSPTG